MEARAATSCSAADAASEPNFSFNSSTTGRFSLGAVFNMGIAVAQSVRDRSTERAARDFARLPGMRSRAASCQNDAYPTSPLCTSQSEPPPPLGPKHDSNCEEFFKKCVERIRKAVVVM